MHPVAMSGAPLQVGAGPLLCENGDRAGQSWANRPVVPPEICFDHTFWPEIRLVLLERGILPYGSPVSANRVPFGPWVELPFLRCGHGQSFHPGFG